MCACLPLSLHAVNENIHIVMHLCRVRSPCVIFAPPYLNNSLCLLVVPFFFGGLFGSSVIIWVLAHFPFEFADVLNSGAAAALAEVLPYGPALCEHCVRLGGLDPARKPCAAPLDAGAQAALLAGVRSWEAWLEKCETNAPEGFIATRSTGTV